MNVYAVFIVLNETSLGSNDYIYTLGYENSKNTKIIFNFEVIARSKKEIKSRHNWEHPSPTFYHI